MFSLLGLSVIVIAFMWLVFEIEIYMKDDDFLFKTSPYLTSMYYVMITLTTIGYGDYFPKTTEGRLVTMIAAVWGAVLISLFVSATQDIFFMKEQEYNAIDLVDMSRASARVIVKALKYYKSRKDVHKKLFELNPEKPTSF